MIKNFVIGKILKNECERTLRAVMLEGGRFFDLCTMI